LDLGALPHVLDTKPDKVTNDRNISRMSLLAFQVVFMKELAEQYISMGFVGKKFSEQNHLSKTI
jgi:hypothetical protein